MYGSYTIASHDNEEASSPDSESVTTGLKKFGKRVKQSDSDRCECGAVETVVHVFIYFKIKLL
jgi:hypothetical protein